MSARVVDASVIVPLFFDEEHSVAAERHVGHADVLLAPDLIWTEVCNVIWKRCRRGEISPDDALAMAADLLRLPLETHGEADLLPDALGLAVHYDRSVYDSLYLALAVRTDSVLLTADRRLANAIAATPLAERVVWIGDAAR